MKITSTVIPAAGYGTRFLPYTKTIPKEMLPLLNTPAIHTIIQECITSHVTNITIISNSEKTALNDYFSPQERLEEFLKKQNKSSLLNEVNNLIQAVNVTFVEQQEQKGLGHAVLMAQEAISDPYFGVILPDDLIYNDTPALAQLLAIAERENASVIAVQEVPLPLISSYGVIAIKKEIAPALYEVETLVEKPAPDQAPSNLAIIGRYILSKNIFQSLTQITPSVGKELQLTDAIAHLIHHQKQRVLAYKITGTRYDIGTPLGWLKANIHSALQHPTYSAEIKKFLQEFLS